MKKLVENIAALILSAMFLGCSGINTSDASNSSTTASADRKATLAFYALTNDYTTTQTEMEDALQSFLLQKTSSSRSASVASAYDITLTATDEISLDKTNTSRSALLDSYENVNLYLYTLENQNDGTKGFAITSTDRRLGNILAVVPVGCIDDVAESPFLELFFDNLFGYIEETADIWNDIDDDYLEEYCKSNNLSRSAEAAIITSGKYTYGGWVVNSGNIDNLISVTWDQWAPYNNVVYSVLGTYYPTGCGPTALAQLFANLEYPNSCSLDGYTDVTYDWTAMKKYPEASSLTSSAKNMVATLMYELGVGLDVSYSTDGTGCSNSSITSYLSENGYSYSGFNDYELTETQSSVDNGYPVLCQGYSKKTVKVTKKKIFGITYSKSTTTTYSYGHYWIVDGYANLTCTAKNSTTDEETTLTADFVHCNLGWSGYCNGYYLSGVFDANTVPVSSVSRSTTTTEYGTKNYYQYKVKMLTQLHHD